MFCRNCGKEVNEKAVACPGCGVPPRVEKKFCSNCGTPTQANQAICVKCGSSLTEGGGGNMSAAGAVTVKCPLCNHEGPLVVTKQLSTGGWVLFGVLLLCCLPLCWIPFVTEGCKQETRKCFACGRKIG